jgi:hypothetical protein
LLRTVNGVRRAFLEMQNRPNLSCEPAWMLAHGIAALADELVGPALASPLAAAESFSQ